LRGGSIEIYTSHWRSPLLENVQAQIIGISRGEPRWRLPFRYRRLRALAPNDEAWRQQSWEAFEAIYARQLEEIGALAVLRDLERIAEDKPAVLLCWERPGDEFCHRWQLADWLHQQFGITVPELMEGMLAKRPDAPQPALFDELPRGERA
jgi:hypothetical protein